MNKNTTPLVIAVVVIVLGGAALWYATKSPAPETVPVVTPLPASVATSTATAPTKAPGAPATAPGLPTGPEVTGRTVWKGITADGWKIAFNVETTWKVSTLSVVGSKDTAQITGGDDTTTYLVSRNLRINEPSGLSYSTKQITIAGKTVAAHVYTAPRAGSAFYLFFALPVGSDTYYFRLESAAASTKIAEDFESLIVIK